MELQELSKPDYTAVAGLKVGSATPRTRTVIAFTYLGHQQACLSLFKYIYYTRTAHPFIHQLYIDFAILHQA